MKPYRLLAAAVLAATLGLGACHHDQSAVGAIDDASLHRAQDALSQPAWLHDHLPTTTVGYLRIASPWSLAGAVPNGRPLDAVMAGDANLKAIAALREAIGKDKVLADAGVTPYLLPLLADLRSPAEAVLIDPIGTPSPNSQLLLTMRLAQKNAAELNARFAQFNVPELKLAAPLDDHGDGRLSQGTPLHFDADSGRLFALVSRQPGDASQLAGVIAELKNSKPDSTVAKAIAAQERQIDQSGQGNFGWISLHGLGGLAAGAIPSESVGTLPGDLTAKAESIAFGSGTVDGHGRISLIVHAPQARLLGYLAPKQFAPNFKVAGVPRWVMSFALPGAEQVKTFEDNLALDFGADRAKTLRQADATMQQKLGFGLAELSRWLGPELIAFQDQAGNYAAVRVSDRKALYDHLQTLAQRLHGSYRTQSMDGAEIHILDLPNAAMPSDDGTDPSSHAWTQLFGRLGSHFYWIEDGDFLIFAKVPQALADRTAATLDTPLDAWLKTQGWQGPQNLLGFTTQSLDAQRDAYYTYLQLLQMLGDLSGGSIDLASLPAAHGLNLPTQGVLGMNMGATADDFSLGFSYEQQPTELFTSGGSMAAVAGVAIAAAVAVPAYQDYTVRSQVSAAMAEAAPLRTAVAMYHEENGRWPKDAHQAGIDQTTDSPYVDSVTLGAGGEIRVHFSIAATPAANPKLDDKTLLLTPQGDNWRCHSDDIDAKYLPASCQEP